MFRSTKNVYALKQDIIAFSKQISMCLPSFEHKFATGIAYGTLASKSCLLMDIADSLHKPSKKANLVDRLSRHLAAALKPSASSATVPGARRTNRFHETGYHVTEATVLTTSHHLSQRGA